MNLLRLLGAREPAASEPPHWSCGRCGTRSADLASQAEADHLFGTHETYFCWPLTTSPNPMSEEL